MGLFENVLRDGDTLFRDPVALDYDFIPKLVPYREKQQKYVASCINPLFSQRNGKNVLVHGPPGVGKTVAIKHILREIEEKTDEIFTIYINCWEKNSSYKIFMAVCDALDYKFTHNKKTDELFAIIENILNKKSAVFVFDEIDKIEDHDFLYLILERIYRKSIVLISNYKEWILDLDERIKSRLLPEMLEFQRYNEVELKGILKNRMEYAFVPNVFNDDAFNIAAKKAAELEDVRSGLYILRESGNIAEEKSSKKISLEHVTLAIKKLEDFSIKKKDDLSSDEKMILRIIKENSGKKIGELFNTYQKNGGMGVYKTFQRKINSLEKSKFVSVKKVSGGPDGNTTMITANSSGKIKKLSDF